jgi:chemotaxis signal transduction protein
VQQLLVARLGQRWVGWTTAHVEEIAAMPRLFDLAQPFPHLLATAFMRGRLVTVIDSASLLGEAAEDPGEGVADGLLLRMAAPLANLAFAVPGIEAALPFRELELREQEAGGVWMGLYPWQDVWVSVIDPSAVADELGRAVALAIRNQSAGREHAS